jgi:hypothetical protein
MSEYDSSPTWTLEKGRGGPQDYKAIGQDKTQQQQQKINSTLGVLQSQVQLQPQVCSSSCQVLYQTESHYLFQHFVALQPTIFFALGEENKLQEMHHYPLPEKPGKH